MMRRRSFRFIFTWDSITTIRRGSRAFTQIYLTIIRWAPSGGPATRTDGAMYFIKRILFLVPLLLLISFLAFVLVHALPGGPFDRERTPASPDIERRLLAKYHLDEPVLKQYARYLNGILHGDFGPSMKYRNHTVTDIIAAGLPVSLTLGALAFCFALGVGLPLGFFNAVRKGQWQDYAGSFAAA